MVVLAILFSGCGDKKTNTVEHDNAGNHINTEGYHVHEDGSVHADHTNTAHTQEEFKIVDDTSFIKSDSLANKINENSH